jgi:protocatechuate 3,4-dioxygenase beta subunit
MQMSFMTPGGMKLMYACFLAILLGVVAVAQNPAGAGKPASRASIEGIVTKEPGSELVKKALVELIAENQTEGGDYTAITGVDGRFHIEGILPGRYRLFAERNGMLDADKRLGRGDGHVVVLTAGQELKEVRIRLQAAAVVRGRVTDEDGDPLPGADVGVLRETFVAGHKRWEQAGGERTNDLGEYRIAGLAAGNYYVSVSPPPDFKTLIEAAGAVRPAETGAQEKPATTTYQTTYYPGTVDRSQASAIQLHAGDEFPVNFSLLPGPSLSIRGSVVNLPPRSSAVVMLQSRDFNLVLNGADMRKDGSFVIHDVSPGNYTILATVDGSPVPMMARQALQVGASNVEGLRLSPEPGGWIRGRLRVETKGNAGQLDLSQIFLAIQPVDSENATGEFSIGDRFSNLAHVSANGSFEWKDVPPGNYYIQFATESDATADWFVKSIMAGGREAGDAGISVNGGVVDLEMVASASGAVVDGVVADQKGEPVANAVVVAVPEAGLRGRLDRYRKTVSDQSGRFTLHGIPPGSYTLFAWESVDGEAYYNPEFVKSYEEQGSALRVAEGDHKGQQLTVIPAAEDQQ